MDLTSTPRLAPGCRLHATEPVLLVPEGTLQLEGPARDILLLLNGKTTLDWIVDELSRQYPDVNASEIAGDVLSLLTRMQERGVVRA